MSKVPAKPSKTAARDRFVEMLSEFHPHEFCKIANRLRDDYAKLIEDARYKIVMVERFPEIAAEYPGKPTVAEYASRQNEYIEWYQRVILLAEAYREAEREFTLPQIVASIKARHA